LEWYRLGFDDRDLMNEVADLLEYLGFARPLHSTYQAIWQDYFGNNVHDLDLDTLKQMIQSHIPKLSSNYAVLNQADGQMLLFSHLIEPKLGKERPVLVYDYPTAQAALAKTSKHEGQNLAKRFELFYKGIELANGYDELSDGDEFLKRFFEDEKTRQAYDQPCMSIDPYLLAALDQMPECAGVALGLDRLLMLQMNKQHIDEVAFIHDVHKKG